MAQARVCVLRTAGTNCDHETAAAFRLAGAQCELVHINRLIAAEKNIHDYEILAFPGGFSYGDDIASGKIFANELRTKLSQDLTKFIRDGKLMIGICNGFQILVKAGILPGNGDFHQEASLIINDSGKYEDRWVYLKSQKVKGKNQKCVWTRDVPEVIYLPVGHGEGKFVVDSDATLERLKKNGQIVFQYCDSRGSFAGYPDNPNGSLEHIAGICDETGRILGLMPHPERHALFLQHPRWTGMKEKSEGDGLQIFRNGVEYVQNNL